jgi:hypothetical protein
LPDNDASLSEPGRIRSAFAGVEGAEPEAGKRIHRFIQGLDDKARVMSDDEVASELNDPFARLLLREGVFPQNLEEILAGVDERVDADDPLRQQMGFLVGEGSQILWSEETKELNRGLRLAVTRGRESEIDLLVSTDASALTIEFLQVMAWDEQNGVFHFYELKRGEWFWAGNSFHALDPESRGNGPFDSHVNGAMVMKELKPPWNHWHSVDATVPPEVFAPDDEMRVDPLFTELSGGEVFQPRVVEAGIRRWTDRRFAKVVGANNAVEELRPILAQLFTTTTVNLVSSDRQSRTIQPEETIGLPASFFVDVDALSGKLGLSAPPPFQIQGQIYLDALERFEVALVDEGAGFRQPGDTHFAFLVPERAFEDLDVVKKCLEIGLLSDRLVGCVLMVDFANPTFSKRRAALLERAPAAHDGASNLSEVIGAAIVDAADEAGEASPEAEFSALWQLGDGWRAEAESRLQALYAAISERLKTAEGFDDYFRLAESRRGRVRELALSERRPLLFATSNISLDQPLVMNTDGSVGSEAD